MPIVTFQPSGATVHVPPGTELIAAARTGGVPLDADCGGRGTCGACMVRIVAGQADCDNPGNLSDAALADGYVLACRTTVLDQPITVQIPEQIGYADGQFTHTDDGHVLFRGDLLPHDVAADPLVFKQKLQVARPQREDGLSDIDRLTRAIRQTHHTGAEVHIPLSVIRAAAEAIRRDDGIVTVTMIRDGDWASVVGPLEVNSASCEAPNAQCPMPSRHLRVVRIEPGDTAARSFAVAVDVGTTTVSVQLIDLTTGRAIGSRTDYNGQLPCGLDVLSRINYAHRPGGLSELRHRVLETINGLIGQLAEAHHLAPADICLAAVSGNTTMTHLLLGLPPEHIRLDPYTPTVMSMPLLTGGEVGLAINPESAVHVSPAVGSYVGGDITAGLLCTELPSEPERVSLFIDIGTNGELAIGNAEFLLTCACSAGPAFEGGGIDCGMRAAAGAIERVDIDPASGAPSVATIGNVKPKGICGSGMIDLLAKLLTTGWIDQAGRLDRTRPNPAIVVDGRKAKYVLADGIAVSETDIENIMRAKAAIYSAAALMLKHVGLKFADLASVYIAGGFGRFIDLDNARTIGLLPDLPAERFHYLGNASLAGSHMLAVSRQVRRRQHELAGRMTCLDLSTEPSYMEQYTAALFLPHTDRAAFPEVWASLEGNRRGAARVHADDRLENCPAATNKQQALDGAMRLAIARLAEVDISARCPLLGLPTPGPDGSLCIQLFGREVRLSPPGFEAIATDGGQVKPADRLLALHYLLCDRPIVATGQLITFRDLPGGQFYWSSFKQRSTLPLVKRFGNDLDALRGNLARFQWRPVQLGDFAATVQAVGPVEVTVVYRCGDEEFGPDAELLFDASIRHVFNTEDAAALAGRICIGLL